jgi:hypothetical protein
LEGYWSCSFTFEPSQSCFKRTGIRRYYDLFDTFGLGPDTFGATRANNFIEINIPIFGGKGSGIKFLLECLRSNDDEYDRNMIETDLMIASANDDIGAIEIDFYLYKSIFLVCNGDDYCISLENQMIINMCMQDFRESIKNNNDI